MRIVAGKWGGRVLRAPRGMSVRPTTDRVREALFSILGARVEGASVLDLFAGTGALAIEALSRGAERAVLVEPDAEAFAAAVANLASVGAAGAETVRADFRKAIRRLAAKGSRFDLAFLDPPYGKGLAEAAAKALDDAGLLLPGATVVVEEASRTPDGAFPAGWRVACDRRYGDTRVIVLETEAPTEGGQAPPQEQDRR